MRVVIQRVSEAKVTIDGNVISTIRNGLAVLLAIEDADNAEDIEWLSGKIVRLRIFDDSEGLMNRSVLEVQGEILLISQFTLFASTKKGNRPSFSRSARPETAVPLYETFIFSVRAAIPCPRVRSVRLPSCNFQPGSKAANGKFPGQIALQGPRGFISHATWAHASVAKAAGDGNQR